MMLDMLILLKVVSNVVFCCVEMRCLVICLCIEVILMCLMLWLLRVGVVG